MKSQKRNLVMDPKEYVHINDDPHDGWWLRPEWQDENDEYQDSEDGNQCQESS